MSLKISKLGSKQKQGGKPLGWFPGFCLEDSSSHPLLGGKPAAGRKGGALQAGAEKTRAPALTSGH